MPKEEFAYCGLNCTTCKSRFADIRQKIRTLDAAFENVNITAMAKAIPLMHSKYRGYRKMADFFGHECPGCRNGGGNPFCGIRKCAKKKGYFTCVECTTDLCRKFSSLLKIHNDNEIQNNRELLRNFSRETEEA
ncbi:MAG: DUF3795 domain-containing protein [Chitinispirillaceae bacterium]|nr:DUF3795 domain-containing protein [Chitinispirillaceae bacterium]